MSATNEVRDWSSLPNVPIDGIVATLKKEKSWRLDGPSLRGVNRHWYDTINHNLTELRPHRFRALTVEDSKSLVKFNRAVTVELDAFVRRAASAAEYTVLTDSLAAMPALSRLELSDCGSSVFLANSRSLAGLSRVTSLKCALALSREHLNVTLKSLRVLPIQELTVNGWIFDMDTLLENVPALKELTLSKHIDAPSDAAMSKLQQLDHLSLRKTTIAISDLAALSSLVHVGISIKPRDMVSVGRLTQVKSLALTVSNTSGEEQSRLDLDPLSCLTKMTFLEIDSNSVHSQPFELSCPLWQLKKLVIGRLALRGSLVRHYLSGVERLWVISCHVLEVDDFAVALKSAERLLLMHNSEYHSIKSLRLSWQPSDLSKLLVASFSFHYPQNLDDLNCVLSLTQLEKLSILLGDDRMGSGRMFVQQLKKLDRMPRLRVLAVDGFYRVVDLTLFLSFEALWQLECLALNVSRLVPSWEDSDMAENEGLRALKARAPRMRLMLGRTELSDIVSKWF